MDDEMDSESMDDEMDSESMDDDADAWSMEKSNNALDSGSMDDASGDESMDDESDAWSMEKSNNALAPGTTETSGEPDSVPTGTTDALTPLTPGTTGSNNALNPLGTTPAETDNALSPLSIGGPPGTNHALSPLSSGFRIEGNITGNVQETGVCSAGNVCSTGGEFAETMLANINQERALVGVPPLTWNNTLAAHAQTYADYLMVTGKNEHPSAEWVATHPTGPEGENLAWFSGPPAPTPSPKDIAQAAFNFWVSEKANYHGQLTGSETPGEVIGHYTQMVWKDTTQIGCASVTSGDGSVSKISCRFTPPGNYVGQTPY
jgi:pathogenesis-related protein 1